MSTTLFILVVAAIGFVYVLIFRRMRTRWKERHPGKDDGRRIDPVESWLTGEVERDEDEDDRNRRS